MTRLLFACLGLATLVFTGGCASIPFLGGDTAVGRIVGVEYCPAPNLPSGHGRVAVRLLREPGIRQPTTRWRLVDANGPGRFRTATAGQDCNVDLRTDTYGLTFEFPPSHCVTHPGDRPPEPRMITVMEEQIVTVLVSYR